jgi:hypothetical protein
MCMIALESEADHASVVSAASEIVAMLPTTPALRKLVMAEVAAQCEDRECRLAGYTNPSMNACILAEASSSPGTG